MTYTYPENVTPLMDLITHTSTASNGWYGIGIIIAMFFVVLGATWKGGSKRAYAAASFLTALFAIFMRILGLVNDKPVVIAIVMAGIGIIWLVLDNQ